ncbi:MAG: hypothetical protein DCF25_08835 [Leptolyngbya foveolarum]|uniref:Uncharacterized protein n=1 Tax=Leptolyngbya foveolarum TaxID=47253 RepID=A0A2W4WJ56_9CYAN|nr:MAG: hypothetical protein DCF25_08835 [Leptolyngbya foveolarum]
MYSVFASYLSESWQVPLSVIIHDQDELFAKSEAGRRWIKDNWPKVIDQARRVWTVSPELADVYKVSGKKKTSTLFPIPGKSNNEFSSWQKTFEYAPVIGYAGNIYPSQVKYFRKIAAVLKKANGTLLLVTPKLDSSVQSLIDSFSNIEHHEPFSNNSDVVKFLKEKASCILICYTFTVSELPWTLTSFPSKLVEFSSLGLPMVILSPDTTALGKWAKTSAWRSCLHEFDEDKLLEIFNQLRKKQCWIDMATQTKNAAMTEFDADTIHFQFESELAVRR